MPSLLALVLGFTGGIGALFAIASLRGIAHPSLAKLRRSNAKRNHDDRPLVEALAVWIEQLRDMMAGARGLEQAIVASSTTAPANIRPAVGRLAANLDFQPLSSAARAFANEIAHPLADFVSAVFITTSQHQARDVVALLSQLAETCRDEVTMRTRVWVSRARTRSAVRIIVVVVGLFITGLFVFNRSYLEPYSTPTGIVVLMIVFGLFTGSFVGLNRLSQFDMPARFVAAGEVER